MRLHILSLSWCLVGCLFFQGVLTQQNQPPPGGYYTTRYDHIDIEHILNQKRLVHYYSECLLDRGPCTPQGIEFKRILPEALRTNCLRCSEKQRFVTLKSIKRLKKEYPSVWAELAAIWDPTGDYLIKLEDSLKGKSYKLPETSQEGINDVSAPMPSENKQVITRFNEESAAKAVNVQNVRQSGTISSPKPQIETVQIVTANTIANKPVSFTPSTTTTTTTKSQSTSSTMLSTTSSMTPSTAPSTMQNKATNPNTIRTTTKKFFTTVLQDKIQSTTTRISYNYDFSATVRPIQVPGNGINMVIRGVIQPITDIAGRVITAGTDIAGIVLNALGVRRTY